MELASCILRSYQETNPVESNPLRAFNSMLNRKQNGKLFYDIVCESCNDDCSDVHAKARAIWLVSQLDTINVAPVDAKSRMPNSSGDGLKAPK